MLCHTRLNGICRQGGVKNVSPIRYKKHKRYDRNHDLRPRALVRSDPMRIESHIVANIGLLFSPNFTDCPRIPVAAGPYTQPAATTIRTLRLRNAKSAVIYRNSKQCDNAATHPPGRRGRRGSSGPARIPLPAAPTDRRESTHPLTDADHLE